MPGRGPVFAQAFGRAEPCPFFGPISRMITSFIMREMCRPGPRLRVAARSSLLSSRSWRRELLAYLQKQRGGPMAAPSSLSVFIQKMLTPEGLPSLSIIWTLFPFSYSMIIASYSRIALRITSA